MLFHQRNIIARRVLQNILPTSIFHHKITVYRPASVTVHSIQSFVCRFRGKWLWKFLHYHFCSNFVRYYYSMRLLYNSVPPLAMNLEKNFEEKVKEHRTEMELENNNNRNNNNQ